MSNVARSLLLAALCLSASGAEARPLSCHVLVPRFEPKTRAPAPEAVRFAGGAKRRFLVAVPCRRAIRPEDV